jgi:hypothetical protein
VRHATTGTDALKAKLRVATKLTVDESRTKFRRWDAMPLARVSGYSDEKGLTAAGGLEAEWYKNAHKYLTLRFGATDDSVFYGLFNGKHIHEGVDTVEALAEILKSNRARPLRWK